MPRISEATLAIGCWFEDVVEQILREKLGYHVNRNCDQKGKHGTKAPMAWGPFDAIRLPDLELIGQGTTKSGDCKYKHNYSTRYQLPGGGSEENHGIDIPNWEDYCKFWQHSGQEGFMVIGEGSTGRILYASAAALIPVSRFHRRPTQSFPDGGVFWPRHAFRHIGDFDPNPIKQGWFRFQGVYLPRTRA